jgi:streptogramin lyase
VAVDAAGHVLVADQGRNQVVEFSSTGAYMRSFGRKGSGPGDLAGPAGVALDGQGNIWVADTGNNRVDEFTGSGSYVRSIGSKGTSPGHLASPYAVALTKQGEVWVADTGNRRVEEFTPTGGFVRSFATGATEVDGVPVIPTGVAVDAMGNVWVANFNPNFDTSVGEFTPAGKLVFRSGTDSHLYQPVGVTVDGHDHVWVTDVGQPGVNNPDQNHAQVFEFDTRGVQLAQISIRTTVPTPPPFAPWSVAVDTSGNVWVADSNNDQVDEFTAGGAFVHAINGKESGPGSFSLAANVAVSKQGAILVSTLGGVKEFTPEGAYLRSLPISNLVGLAVDADGNIWTANILHSLEEYTAAGVHVRSISGGTDNLGNSEEQLAVDHQERVWVTDPGGDDSILEFTVRGFQGHIDSGTTAAGPSVTQGIAIDTNGDLLTTDEAHGRVLEFTPTGRFVRSIGERGSGPGQLAAPYAVAVDAQGHIWVADPDSSRVVEYTSTGAYMRSLTKQ